MEITDLVRKAQQGDEEAFGVIVQTYRKRILGTIYRLTGRLDEVDDIAQEVYLRLFASLPQLRSPDVFNTWLYRLTTNAVYDYLRRRRRNATVPMADLTDEQMDSADAAESRRRYALHTRRSEARETLERLLAEAPAEDRELLVRQALDGLSLRDLRRIYHTNENALKVRLFRARRRVLETHRRMAAA